MLRDTVTTEAVIKGQQAVFLVAGSGSAAAVTRGTNGRIPARPDSLTQNTCTLQEWHDLVRKTGFNVFASQGNQRAVMQMTTLAVINRKIDSLIINAARGNSFSIDEDDTATAIALPAGQKVAVGGTGLTLAKMISGLEILNGAEDRKSVV